MQLSVFALSSQWVYYHFELWYLLLVFSDCSVIITYHLYSVFPN